jgi:hypothetical protein
MIIPTVAQESPSHKLPCKLISKNQSNDYNLKIYKITLKKNLTINDDL